MTTLHYNIVNFLTYLAIGIFLYHKYGKPLLQARAKNIADELRDAELELAQARQAYETAQARLGSIDGEKQALHERLEDEGTKLSKLLIQQAEQTVERVQRDTAKQIEAELNQASQEIRQEVVRLASEQARAQLEETLSVDDDRRLRKAALESL